MSKRQNNAIWKIQDQDGLSPEELLANVLTRYAESVTNEPAKYARLSEVSLSEDEVNENLRLYIRKRTVPGMYKFVEQRLDSAVESKHFSYYPKDVCLFIITPQHLYVITGGSGYHIIEDFVDYAYPFDVAKKLIANSFKASQKRQIAGSALSIDEKYRRDVSIDKNKTLHSIWKSLVGKIDPDQLPNGSFLRDIIDLDKPPTAEIKSSFTLKKSLSLDEVTKLISAIENLAEPTEEHKKAMDFLDCLQPVKSTSLKRDLQKHLLHEIFTAANGDTSLDLDICDPKDVDRYLSGSAYTINGQLIGDDRPDIDAVMQIITSQLKELLVDEQLFTKELKRMQFNYTVGEDGFNIGIKLINMFHGQLIYEDKTYFLIDGIWHRGQGDYLQNLIDDFINCTFSGVTPLINVVNGQFRLISWGKKSDGSWWDEDTFNKEQAKEANFYYGDKIFLRRGRGKIELFDLLYVDEQAKIVYILHVKDDFDAKIRDVCSQITTARDTINNAQELEQDFRAYYNDWHQDTLNQGVDESTFLNWFGRGYKRIYMIVCSTKYSFEIQEFIENRKVQSYVAKREIVLVKEDFRGKDDLLGLMHTQKVAQ